jgi:MoxR-like ATPase
MSIHSIHALAEKVKRNIAQVIVGKDSTVDLLLVALIGSGHALIEDVPGTGKTMLAKTLSKSLNMSFKRIQFTPDLLPSDISGIYYYHQESGEFRFRPGPLFSHVVLADEINRATPRTQSSLLEAMEERQVTVDGDTKPLESPFLVLATQNPIENQGTFPLPEAQLDRFLLKIGMGYPSENEGLDILKRFQAANPLEQLMPVADASDIIEAQRSLSSVRAHDDLLRYILAIAEKTRSHPDIVLGVSPRGTQALLRASQAYAAIQGRDYVLPDDIKALIHPVLGHRIVLSPELRWKERQTEAVLDRIVHDVPVPSEDWAKLGVSL